MKTAKFTLKEFNLKYPNDDVCLDRRKERKKEMNLTVRAMKKELEKIPDDAQVSVQMTSIAKTSPVTGLLEDLPAARLVCEYGNQRYQIYLRREVRDERTFGGSLKSKDGGN